MPKQKRLTAAEYQGGGAKKAKPSKYLNIKTIVDGIKFDSKKEAARYTELKVLERSGQIGDLKCHTKYDLVVKGKRVCTYSCDFEYRRLPSMEVVVEDVKSEFSRTKPSYRIKKKLFEAIFAPLTITEV